MRLVLCCSCIALLIWGAVGRAEDAVVTKQFKDLLAAEWEYGLRESPTFASHLGDRRYNDRWPDVSLEAIDRRHEHRKQTFVQLGQIDETLLSAADRLNYRLYRKEL